MSDKHDCMEVEEACARLKAEVAQFNRFFVSTDLAVAYARRDEQLRIESEAEEKHRDCTPETCRCFKAGLESVISIRCLKHYAVPPYNRNEHGGGECGACIAESPACTVKCAWCGRHGRATSRAAAGAPRH